MFYCKEWPWHIRELELGKFLVRSPQHKKVSNIKNYPFFNMMKDGVQVEVLEWLEDIEAYDELQVTWIQIKVSHTKMVSLESFSQTTSGFGLMIEVGWTTLFKIFYDVVKELRWLAKMLVKFQMDYMR